MQEIKFATPDVGSLEYNAVKNAIESKWLTNGLVVRSFEQEIAKRSRCKKAVAFDSCTAAMEMTLRVLGVGEGDEVITTPYTYSATAEVIRNVGAKIVFVDLDGSGFEMNYCKVAEAITPCTKAIIPVDIGGKPCDYDEIFKAVKEKSHLFRRETPLQYQIGRVAVIADAAHSFGAEMNGKVSGEFADFTCFSFHVLKNLTTGGEGGVVVWNSFDKSRQYINDDELEKEFRLLGDHGQTSRDKSNGWEYDISLFGYNHIMTNIDAAMGLAQLERFDEINEKRRKITERYDELFKNKYFAMPLIKHFGENYTSAMHLYPIRLNTSAAPISARFIDGILEDWRTGIYKKLRDRGVPCNVHYKPLPMMTAYKNEGYDIADYPNAYRLFSTLLTIPYHSELTPEQQEYIVEEIEKAVKPVC